MGKLADCPYCGGQHRTKRAFKKCEAKNVKRVWRKTSKATVYA